jgi:site-specific DNA-methyltransferase (adenine-specific)
MIITGYCEKELKNIEDNSIDLIFTSPPYANQRKNTYGGISEKDYVEWFIPIAYEIKRILKPTGSFFLNIKPNCKNGERSLYVFELIIALKREVGFLFVEEYCWIKNPFPTGTKGRFKNGFEPIYHFTKSKPGEITFNPLACGTKVGNDVIKRAHRKNSKIPLNGSGMVVDRENFKTIELARPSNVIKVNNTTNQFFDKIEHSAVFSEKLVDFFIKSFSNEGDLVLDPFAGSGTVGKSAIENNRKYILIEKEEKYIELIKKRLYI